MFLKTLKVFFFLKYKETLGSIPWKSVFKSAGVILLAFFVCLGAMLVLGYCGYLLGWVNKYDIGQAGATALGVIFILLVFIYCCVQVGRLFFRWIRDNWREARRIVREKNGGSECPNARQ